jgi:hypothetical protein
MTRQITVIQDMFHELEDQQCLVFYLGGIPSADGSEVPKYWVFGTELPDAETRPTILLQRLANPHLPDGTPDPDDAELHRRNQVTLLSMDLDRPGSAPADAGGASQIQQWLLVAKQRASEPGDGYAGSHARYQDIFVPVAVDPSDPSAANDGRKYKMLVAPLIIELDGAAGGCDSIWIDLGYPVMVAGDGRDVAAADSFYGTGVYKSVDSGSTW